MRRRSFHLLLIGVLVLPLLLAAIVGIWMEIRNEAPETSVAPSPTASLAPPRPPAARPGAPPIEPDAPPPDKTGAAEDAAVEPPPGEPSASAEPLDALESGGWEVVDLEGVRASLPHNIYWTMSSPTKDPKVLEAREAERDRWNVEYGKVLSNTATAEEIDAYYMQRKRLSSDYIEFATHLLVNYGTKLPKRDVGLLKLAIDMHLARLEEIPRQIAEAQERRIAHDAARRAWLEEQKAFDDPAPDESTPEGTK